MTQWGIAWSQSATAPAGGTDNAGDAAGAESRLMGREYMYVPSDIERVHVVRDYHSAESPRNPMKTNGPNITSFALQVNVPASNLSMYSILPVARVHDGPYHAQCTRKVPPGTWTPPSRRSDRGETSALFVFEVYLAEKGLPSRAEGFFVMRLQIASVQP